ncbi:MAG: hypothetical protein H0U86_13610 [Chloroflexi bacterium]|nr:hypothetical protein [Chloroflexota bacterium]
MKRITILLALLLLVAAGCASQSGSSADAEPTPTEAATPEPTATEEPSEDAEGSAGAIPSFDLNGDPELAARFPDTVGGQPISVQSFRGDTFMAGGGTDPSFTAFLDSVGAELEDVSVAFGGAMSGESVLSVAAFRVLGADEDQLETEFLAASQAEGDIEGLEQTSVGGKDVWSAADTTGAGPGLSMYIYVKDDTVYFLTGSEEQAAEILAALP